MYLKFQVQSKAGTIFSLLPFSFSYLTEVLSPQSLAIGYQLPAEPETKLSLKQRGEKREKSTKESWSQLLLGSPAGSVARTKARGCCRFCASCHRPAKPPGAQRGTACLQSIPTTAFSHALLSQELQQTHPNSWNGQKNPHGRRKDHNHRHRRQPPRARGPRTQRSCDIPLRGKAILGTTSQPLSPSSRLTTISSCRKCRNSKRNLYNKAWRNQQQKK